MYHHFFVSLLVAAATLFLALVAAAAAEIASRLALSSATVFLMEAHEQRPFQADQRIAR